MYIVEKKSLPQISLRDMNTINYMRKRTKDWIIFKNLNDDDYIVLGYIEKETNVVSIIIDQ